MENVQSPEAFTIEQRFYHVLIRLTLLGAGIGTLLALFSRFYWVAELFSHFRLYYLISLALLVLTFLHTKHYVLLTLAILLLVPNIWYVEPYLRPLFFRATEASEGSGQVSVVALNLQHRNGDHGRIKAYLENVSADIVVLAEYTPQWELTLTDLDAIYPHSMRKSRIGPFGMAVLSKLPLVNAEPLDLGVPDSANFRAVVSLDNRLVELFAVHLFPPTSAERARWRDTQLDNLGQILTTTSHPRLVIGDMNITPFSPLFGDLLNTASIEDARQPQGVYVTWPTYPLPIWIPIDHCLADPVVGVTTVNLGPDVGSDHYPLEITITGSD